MVPPCIEGDATRWCRPDAGRGVPPSGLPAQLPVVEVPLAAPVLLDVRALRGLVVGGHRGAGIGQFRVDAHGAGPWCGGWDDGGTTVLSASCRASTAPSGWWCRSWPC